MSTRRTFRTDPSSTSQSSSFTLPSLTAAEQRAVDFPQHGSLLAQGTRVFASRRFFHARPFFDAAVVTGTNRYGRYTVRFADDGRIRSVPLCGLVFLSAIKEGLQAFTAERIGDTEETEEDAEVKLIHVPDGENEEEWNQCAFKCAGDGDVKITVPWSKIYFELTELCNYTLERTHMPSVAPRVHKRGHVTQATEHHADPEHLPQDATQQVQHAYPAQNEAQPAQNHQDAAQQQVELPQPLQPDDPAGALAAAIVAKVELVDNDDDVIILRDVPSTPKRRRLTPGVQVAAQPLLPAAATQIVFGNAIPDPDDDKVVSYQSPFFTGKVFKFREVQTFVADDGRIRRHYKCIGCAEVSGNPRYNGPLPVLVYTENGKFVDRDPDAPLESKHLCLRPKHHHDAPYRPKLEVLAANDAI